MASISNQNKNLLNLNIANQLYKIDDQSKKKQNEAAKKTEQLKQQTLNNLEAIIDKNASEIQANINKATINLQQKTTTAGTKVNVPDVKKETTSKIISKTESGSTSEAKTLWDEVDNKILSTTTKTVQGIVKADSASSVSGGGNAGGQAGNSNVANPWDKISQMSDEEYRSEVIKNFSVEADNLSSLSGKNISGYEETQFSEMLVDLTKRLKSQVFNNFNKENFPLDEDLANTCLKITLSRINADDFYKLNNLKKLSNINVGKFYEYYTNLFNNVVNEVVEGEKIKKPTSNRPNYYSVISDMTQSAFHSALSSTHTVSANKITNYTSVDDTKIIIGQYGNSHAVDMLRDLFHVVYKEIEEEIMIQCYKNNVKYDNEMISNVENVISGNVFDYVKNHLWNFRLPFKNNNTTAKVDKEKIKNYIVNQFNIIMNSEISKKEKPTLKIEKFEFNPNSKLSEGEQFVQTYFKNLIVKYLEILKKYGDGDVVFLGRKQKLSEVISGLYDIIHSHELLSNIAETTEQLSQELEDACNNYNVQADGTSSSGGVSAGSTSGNSGVSGTDSPQQANRPRRTAEADNDWDVDYDTSTDYDWEGFIEMMWGDPEFGFEVFGNWSDYDPYDQDFDDYWDKDAIQDPEFDNMVEQELSDCIDISSSSVTFGANVAELLLQSNTGKLLAKDFGKMTGGFLIGLIASNQISKGQYGKAAFTVGEYCIELSLSRNPYGSIAVALYEGFKFVEAAKKDFNEHTDVGTAITTAETLNNESQMQMEMSNASLDLFMMMY